MPRNKAPARKKSPRKKRVANPVPDPVESVDAPEAPIELEEPGTEEPEIESGVAEEPEAEEPERPGAGPPTPIHPEEEEPEEAPTEPVSPPKPFAFRATLIDGGRYSTGGHDFVLGRPVTSTNRKLYERLRFNGRFRVDVV